MYLVYCYEVNTVLCCEFSTLLLKSLFVVVWFLFVLHYLVHVVNV